jgi:hypothetical protein
MRTVELMERVIYRLDPVHAALPMYRNIWEELLRHHDEVTAYLMLHQMVAQARNAVPLVLPADEGDGVVYATDQIYAEVRGGRLEVLVDSPRSIAACFTVMPYEDRILVRVHSWLSHHLTAAGEYAVRLLDEALGLARNLRLWLDGDGSLYPPYDGDRSLAESFVSFLARRNGDGWAC